MLNEPAAPGEPSMEELAAQMGGAGQTAVFAPGRIMPSSLSDCCPSLVPHSLMHGFSAVCLAWAEGFPSAAKCMGINTPGVGAQRLGRRCSCGSTLLQAGTSQVQHA